MYMNEESEHLFLKVINEKETMEVLRFYISNKEYFEPFEPKHDKNFYTIEYQKTILSLEYNEIIKGNILRYWLYEKENTKKIIGTISFQNITGMPFKSASIGYRLDRMYWGKGYAYEACKKGLEIIFNNYKLHRIEANIMPNNSQSIKLINRLGFTYEGIEYSVIKINNEWEDHYRFSLINPYDKK